MSNLNIHFRFMGFSLKSILDFINNTGHKFIYFLSDCPIKFSSKELISWETTKWLIRELSSMERSLAKRSVRSIESLRPHWWRTLESWPRMVRRASIFISESFKEWATKWLLFLLLLPNFLFDRFLYLTLSIDTFCLNFRIIILLYI